MFSKRWRWLRATARDRAPLTFLFSFQIELCQLDGFLKRPQCSWGLFDLKILTRYSCGFNVTANYTWIKINCVMVYVKSNWKFFGDWKARTVMRILGRPHDSRKTFAFPIIFQKTTLSFYQSGRKVNENNDKAHCSIITVTSITSFPLSQYNTRIFWSNHIITALFPTNNC